MRIIAVNFPEPNISDTLNVLLHRFKQESIPELCLSVIMIKGMRAIRERPRFLSSVLRCVMQFDGAAGPLLIGIDDACIEWPRINVQTHSPLLALRGVKYAVHRLQWIYRHRI